MNLDLTQTKLRPYSTPTGTGAQGIHQTTKPGDSTTPGLTSAHVAVERGAACEYHDPEGYDEAIREAAFAALDLARYREIRDQADTPEAESERQCCADRPVEASAACRSWDYQAARKALGLASVHLDRYLQTLDPKFADLREDLMPLITARGEGEPQN